MVFIKIKIIAFGPFQEILGFKEKMLELQSGISLKELLEALGISISSFPYLNLLVNGYQKDIAYEINDNDEIAIMPAPSGG